MRIAQERDGETVVLSLEGRLDREWAEHLARHLALLLQAGVRSAVVGCAGLEYVGTHGIRVLRDAREEFALLRGRFQVRDIAPHLRQVLAAAGWDDAEVPAGASGGVSRQSAWYARSSWDMAAAVQAVVLDQSASVTCHVLEEPAPVHIDEATFALGVGVLGAPATGMTGRAGEFLGAAGCAASFASGSRLPDCFIAAPGQGVPAVLGRGFCCQGRFAMMLRFAGASGTASLGLADLARAALDSCSTGTAGLVVVAESADLCGVRIRRSPFPGPVRFTFPESREWLSFTPDRIPDLGTVLLIGIVTRDPDTRLEPLVRPMGQGLLGHFHAAAFSYAPVPQRTVTPRAMIQWLLEEQELRDVLHLIRDDRAGFERESALVSGIAWVSPVSDVRYPHA